MHSCSLIAGRAAAAAASDLLDAVMAVAQPVVECNRVQIDNGRTYLREMAFGDPNEPHHREALSLTAQTGEVLVDVLRREMPAGRAATVAQIISAVMFVSMAASTNVELSVDELLASIRRQVGVLLG